MYNQEALKLWVADLRSGNREQARGTLTARGAGAEPVEVAHCCLGVLTEVYIENTDAVLDVYTAFSASRDATGVLPIVVTYDGSSSYLPTKVSEWLGSPENPILVRDGWFKVFYTCEYDPRATDYLLVSSAECNDDLGLTFDQIADLIEYFLIEK